MNPTFRRRAVLSILPILMLQLVLSGCASVFPQVARARTAHLEQPIISSYQSFRIISLCLDTPPLMPARFAREAAAALAGRIDSAVTVNFGGLLVFVSYITSQSFQNSATQFSVPGFPADPPAPAKPKLGDDPYANAQSQSDYQKAFAAWQAQLLIQHKKLAVLRNQVKGYTDKLRALVPPYDDKGSDQFGCLQNTSQDFSGVSGNKYLLIASPLVSTTRLEVSSNVSLAGAAAKIIWHKCVPEIASVCQANDAAFKHLLTQYGAKSVTYYDVPQSEVEKPTF